MFKPKVRVGSSFDVDPVEPGHDQVEFDEVIGRMQARSEGMRAWLDEHASPDLDHRAHMEEGSAASAHWHAGYLSAMGDAVALLTGQDAVGYAWDDASKD